MIQLSSQLEMEWLYQLKDKEDMNENTWNNSYD